MFEIRRAQAEDVDTAVDALGAAFSNDPLIRYLFRDSPAQGRQDMMAFFSILLRVRIALAMPAFVLLREGKLLGAAMGYDVTRPAWPAQLTEEWQRFEASVPGFTGRLAAYDAICEAWAPDEPHFYLGVIGVVPSLQGKGGGKALLMRFCEGAGQMQRSGGVYLDTASTDSLQFYLKNGFEVLGEGALDGAPLWCLYRRN